MNNQPHITFETNLDRYRTDLRANVTRCMNQFRDSFAGQHLELRISVGQIGGYWSCAHYFPVSYDTDTTELLAAIEEPELYDFTFEQTNFGLTNADVLEFAIETRSRRGFDHETTTVIHKR